MAMSIAALTDQPIALTDESLADRELEEDDFDVHAEENLIDCFLEQFTVDWDALDPSDDEEVDGPQQIVTGSAPTSFDQDGVASDLVECFHQNQQRWPTLETAFDDLRDTAHAHGFAVKTKREKNADKAEGERSERTNKEFKKMRYVQCACAGVAKADPTASADTGKVTRTRLKGCEWAASIEKIGGRYAIQITGQHNHPATDDIRIYPMARKGTVEQEAFVESLLRARTSTAKILENLEERFGDSCRLIAKDIQNRRQRQREREMAGLPEMDALTRDMMADGAIFHVKQSEEGNITHLIVIPSSVPKLLQEEGKVSVIQIDETYRTNKYGAGMLHIVSSTNTNVTFTLGYCFMQTATEDDLTWVLEAFSKHSIIVDPSVIVTDADQALMNACATVFPEARHLLCLWHIQSNIKAQHLRDFPTTEVVGSPLWTFTTFLQKWSNLVRNTKTKELFEVGWEEMKTHIPTECAQYVENRRIDPHKDKFVGAWLIGVKHFGQISSSKVESADAAFKKTLGTSQLGFFSVYPIMKRVCVKQADRIRLLRAQDKVFIPVVQHNVLASLYTKVSAYALRLIRPQLLLAKKELTQMMTTLPSDYEPKQCDGLCMTNHGLPCQHELLEIMAKGDRKEDQVDPANIHPHWFLNKTFTPATNQREARLLPPIAKKKNARARIPTAAETASKKKTRCSICSVYGHNKSKCPTRIEVANNNARLAAQAQQQQEIFSQPGSSSQASRQSSPTHSIQSSSQHHSSYGYDPLRVTAPRRQYMSQEYFSQYDHSSQFQTNWPQATLPPTRYVTYIGHQDTRRQVLPINVSHHSHQPHYGGNAQYANPSRDRHYSTTPSHSQHGSHSSDQDPTTPPRFQPY